MSNRAMQLLKYLRSPFLYIDAFKLNGILGLAYELQVRRKLWSFKIQNQAKSRNTSLSDKQSYVEICKAAVENDMVFQNFKANIEYREILEHVSWKHGNQYLKLINRPEVLQNLFLRNSEDVGNPIQYEFEEVGFLSPTQIRYAKISQDLLETHGSLNDYTIVEIGIGNGGQALHLMTLQDIESYVLVDIPEVLDLARKILAPNPHFAKFNFVSAFDKISIEADLVISNYAYSELDLDSQEDYFARFLSKAHSGYLLYNYIKKESRNLSAKDLIRRIPGSVVKPEVPLTYPGNVLVTW